MVDLLKYKMIRRRIFLYSLCIKRIKKEGLNKHDITFLVKSQQQFKEMTRRIDLYNEFIRGQELQKQQLEQATTMLKTKSN